MIQSGPTQGHGPACQDWRTDWSDIYDDYMFTFNTQNIHRINSILTLILKPDSGHNNTEENRDILVVLRFDVFNISNIVDTMMMWSRDLTSSVCSYSQLRLQPLVDMLRPGSGSGSVSWPLQCVQLLLADVLHEAARHGGGNCQDHQDGEDDERERSHCMNVLRWLGGVETLRPGYMWAHLNTGTLRDCTDAALLCILYTLSFN